MAEALGMRVVVNDPPRERAEGHCGFVSLKGILREADIITFHVPLTMQREDKTHHLADELFLSKVLPGTILLNSSRGEVVSPRALKQALDQGSLAAAAIDVWENEPQIDAALHQQVSIATPHIAGYSADGKANGTAMSVASLSKFFNIGIESWYPDDVPPPLSPLIQIDARYLSFEEVLAKAILHTYPIAEDHSLLNANPGAFEELRGAYRVRREFQNYQVEISGAQADVVYSLRKLAFRIKEL